MEWTFDAERPIYSQLIEHMERAIITGEYPPSARLPGVRELAQSAGVNPNTMQRALAALEVRGLVYSQRTSGRFVTDDATKITALRAQLAGELTEKYRQSMYALGCTQAEITSYVNAPKAIIAKEEST